MSEALARGVRPAVAAGVLFFDEAGRVMLLDTVYKPDREIPGGLMEAGETPLEAARREVREELGIEPPIGDLLVVDWAPTAPDGGEIILFVFDGGVLAPEFLERVVLQPEEIAAYHFCAAAEIAEHTVPRMARRLTSAIAARRTGRPVYAEHGVPLL